MENGSPPACGCTTQRGGVRRQITLFYFRTAQGSSPGLLGHPGRYLHEAAVVGVMGHELQPRPRRKAVVHPHAGAQ